MGVHLLVSAFGGEVVGDGREVVVLAGGGRLAAVAAAEARYEAAIEEVVPGSGRHDEWGLVAPLSPLLWPVRCCRDP